MAQLGLLSLFQEDSSQTFVESFGENHTSEPNCRLLHGKEIGNLPFRLENDNRARTFLGERAAGARLVNQITDLSGDFRVSEPRLASGQFHCNREELRFVALHMGPQKCDQVARSAHTVRMSLMAVCSQTKCIPEFRPRRILKSPYVQVSRARKTVRRIHSGLGRARKGDIAGSGSLNSTIAVSSSCSGTMFDSHLGDEAACEHSVKRVLATFEGIIGLEFLELFWFRLAIPTESELTF